jgi:hypothetical protein
MKKLSGYLEFTLNSLALAALVFVSAWLLLGLVIKNNIVVLILAALPGVYAILHFYAYRVHKRVSGPGAKRTILGSGVSLYSFGTGPVGNYIEFRCPQCTRLSQTSSLCLGRYWITILYLPLIPLALSAFTECSQCGSILFLGKRYKQNAIGTYNSHKASHYHLAGHGSWASAAFYAFGGMILGYILGSLAVSSGVFTEITLLGAGLAVCGMASGANYYNHKVKKRVSVFT